LNSLFIIAISHRSLRGSGSAWAGVAANRRARQVRMGSHAGRAGFAVLARGCRPREPRREGQPHVAGRSPICSIRGASLTLSRWGSARCRSWLPCGSRPRDGGLVPWCVGGQLHWRPAGGLLRVDAPSTPSGWLRRSACPQVWCYFL
jgi:hypothetical protein